MASRRHPCRAGGFYPSDPGQIREMLRDWSEAAVASQATMGGIVPHAGWIYSGALAYALFRDLCRGTPCPERLVLLGAVHVPGVVRPGLGVFDVWETPIGSLEVDTEFEDALLDARVVDRNLRAHAGEHSIEVQLPMVRALWPELKIVPIATPANHRALELGAAIAKLAQGRGATLVVASTDLTHYGLGNYGYAPAGGGSAGEQFAWANDERFLEVVERLDAPAALAEAAENHNACGAGAVVAALEFARAAGATRGEVLQHTNSLEVGLERGFGRSESFVGYAAVAFRR